MKPYHLLLTILLLMSASLSLAQEDMGEDEAGEPIILQNYAANATILFDELETQGLIPSGAIESVAQNSLTFTGDDAQFSTFALENESRNVVVGAVLNFAPLSDELEFCGIASRTQSVESNRLEDDSNITSITLDAYVATGVDNEGNIFAFETGSESSAGLSLSEIELDLSQPVYLLAIVIDDMLTVFANGEMVIREYELSLDAGGFAFLYAGMDEDSACRAETFFAYTIADELVDSCSVSTNSGVNRREGPGTEFARVDQLLAGESLEAVGQTIGTDGFTWWLLADETWVRDDVVDTSGFCRSLPEVNSEDV